MVVIVVLVAAATASGSSSSVSGSGAGRGSGSGSTKHHGWNESTAGSCSTSYQLACMIIANAVVLGMHEERASFDCTCLPLADTCVKSLKTLMLV